MYEDDLDSLLATLYRVIPLTGEDDGEETTWSTFEDWRCDLDSEY